MSVPASIQKHMLDAMGYKRVRMENNWGNITYFAGDRRLKKGMAVAILFHDEGKLLEAVLQSEKQAYSVNDMGHSLNGTTERIFVTIPNEYGAQANAYLDTTMRVLILEPYQDE